MKRQVGDIGIEYEIDGPEDGPVLMLHHSLSTSHEMWDELNIALAQIYRVLRYDARGHGKTDAPEGPYSFPQLAEDAAGLMAMLGIDSAHHVGISMGGMIAQYMGIALPERVVSLTLVATTSAMPAEFSAIWNERIATVQAHGMAPMVEDTIKRWFTRDFRDGGDEVIGEIATLIANTPPAGFCGCAAAIRDLDLTAQLADVTAPALVLVGADDPGTPPAMARTIADAISGARLEIFDNCSHMLPLQQPDRFLEELIDFIADQDEDA